MWNGLALLIKLDKIIEEFFLSGSESLPLGKIHFFSDIVRSFLLIFSSGVGFDTIMSKFLDIELTVCKQVLLKGHVTTTLNH